MSNRGNAKTSEIENQSRAAAVKAGVDPDSRVVSAENPDKTWPAWCNYRPGIISQMRAEKKVNEALNPKVLPDGVIISSADVPRKDLPLLAIGKHEENTIEQMHNCLQVGDAVGGVICADGHKGYAQPVGGVIAYRNQISVSGVGFDIGCFTGDTRVYTLNHKNVPIKKLVGKDVYVMACKSDGTLVAAKATGKKTRTNAKIMQVTLDNNKKIRCTLDQKFMLLDGNYLEAQDLTINQRLMPFYYVENDGWIIARHNWKTSSLTKKDKFPLQSIHKIVANSKLISGNKKAHVHHIDEIRSNNLPTNLQFMTATAHAKMHANDRDKSHMTEAWFEKLRLQGIKEFWKNARKDPEFMQKRAITAKKNSAEGIEKHKVKLEKIWKQNGKRGSQYLINYNNSPETIAKISKRKAKGTICPICKENFGITNSLTAHFKHEHVEEFKLIDKNSRISMSKQILSLPENHKVKSIKFLTVREDVYCLSVPKYNNFALSSGVFVHNCGNLAVKLDITYSDIKDKLQTVMDDISRNISFGVGRKNTNERVEHALFDNREAWRNSGMEFYRNKAKEQLGTCGSGNHYIDIFQEEVDSYSYLVNPDNAPVWIGVHFGSRGLGHTTATKYLALAGGKDGMDVPPTVLNVDSEIGQAYLTGMHLAGEYAYAGREWVVDYICKMLGAKQLEVIHNHHNFAWPEVHNVGDGPETLWVVRKGATPAFPGQKGFIGGSMGDDAVIIEGKNSPISAQSFYSTVHGAGRIFGRKQAIRTFKRVEMDNWLRRRGTMVYGGDLDESPMAYRRLPEVLAYHSDSINILHTLRPLAVMMAGHGTIDPFKD